MNGMNSLKGIPNFWGKPNETVTNFYISLEPPKVFSMAISRLYPMHYLNCFSGKPYGFILTLQISHRVNEAIVFGAAGPLPSTQIHITIVRYANHPVIPFNLVILVNFTGLESAPYFENVSSWSGEPRLTE